jgi:cytochrome c-type biogenesis protein CcmF
MVFALMGIAPLLGWRKTSPELFKKSFRFPLAAMAVAAVAHLALGKRFGFAPFVHIDAIYPGTLGRLLAEMGGVLPFITFILVAFNIAVVVQEYARGIAARRAASVARKEPRESLPAALVNLVARSRRRYGGYTVHIGIAMMFLGFSGRAWGVDKEVSLSPGQTVAIEEYVLTYEGPRMEVDPEKRMVFADLSVTRNGKDVGKITPAKFIYKSSPQAPSTEVAKHVTLRNDLYVIVGMVSPQTKIAAFQIHVNPLVSLIWIGVAILIMGALVSLWPDVATEEVTAFSYVRAAAGAVTSIMFAILLALAPSYAYASTAGPPDAALIAPTSPVQAP